MTTHKYIYWRPDMLSNENGEAYANVHLIIGYNQGSIADFQNMAEELRKTFPQADNRDICGGKIFKSLSVNGYTIITWNAYIPKDDYPGWDQKDTGRIEYCWELTTKTLPNHTCEVK
ncbi:MAG: hypothetical protein RIQ54_90 [Candidatus Parcubacteria bacterium]|jgi:hypothetical protein